MERDAQFRYINAQVRKFLGRSEPVLSVDTKKKERVGFSSLGFGTAIPNGTYDVQRDEGFVNVGMTHDTAEFAV